MAEVRDTETNAEHSIAAFQKALEVYTVEKYPINYADTQNNLGTAYMVLSGVRNKETNVENAIIAFQKALNVYISEEYPIKYNNTLNNIKKAMEFG